MSAIDAVSIHQFTSFMDFADVAVRQGKGDSVAQLSGHEAGTGKIKSLQIVGIPANEIGPNIRNNIVKANSASTNQLFLDTVINMFGGEKNIPDSVKKVMDFANFDVNKPLTARTIVAVRDAIVEAQEDAALADAENDIPDNEDEELYADEPLSINDGKALDPAELEDDVDEEDAKVENKAVEPDNVKSLEKNYAANVESLVKGMTSHRYKALDEKTVRNIVMTVGDQNELAKCKPPVDDGWMKDEASDLFKYVDKYADRLKERLDEARAAALNH